jgi:hypothetical protein
MNDRLAVALSDRYRTERELGQACPERTRGGGLAIGSRAQGGGHHRRDWVSGPDVTIL